MSSRKFINNKFGRLTLYELLLVVLWPFAALIYGLKQYQSPKSITLFLLFCIYFGFSFVLPGIDVVNSPDSSRYAAQLLTLHEESISFYQVTNLFYNKRGSVDIYQPLITWIVSLFTADARYLFAVFATVFGFFYAKNLWIIYSQVTIKISFLLFLLMLTYALVNPIWNINGVRMWTAAQVFIYGVLTYLFQGDKKQIIWIIISILIHASFFFPVILFLIFMFLPINITAMFVFFWIAAFITEIDFSFVRGLLKYLPQIFQAKYEGYLNETYALKIKTIADSSTWHINVASLTMKWIKYLWIIISYRIIKSDLFEINDKTITTKLFALALFIGGWAQIASLIPSGGRFLVLANALFMATFILLFVYSSRLKNMVILRNLSVPIFLFSALFSIRIGFDYMGIATIFGNVFIGLFIDSQTRLIDFIKYIF